MATAIVHACTPARCRARLWMTRTVPVGAGTRIQDGSLFKLREGRGSGPPHAAPRQERAVEPTIPLALLRTDDGPGERSEA